MSEIFIVEEAESSNSLAMEWIGKQTMPEFSIIWVKNQTKGRGQGNNSWHSKPNENITISMIVYPVFLKPENFFFLSKITAIATHKLIHSFAKNTYIKWPNDIYVNNKKIAGILIENKMSQTQLQASVIGVGINVNQSSFPENIPNPTSLFLETKETFSIELIISEWQKCFIEYYQLLISESFEEIDSLYHQHLYMKNKTVHLLTNKNQTIVGSIQKVNNAGELVVQVNNQQLRFSIGEVDLVKIN